MKTFIRKIMILASIIATWGLANIMLDPFEYFKLSIIDIEFKRSAKRVNQLLYKTFYYLKNPGENLIIGDSRVGKLPLNLAEDFSNEKWKKLSIGALKLDEIFDLFYLTNNRKGIKKVIIGINFNMFNAHSFTKKVSGLEKMLENPLRYIYNKDVTEASFYVARSILTGKHLTKTSIIDKEAYWNWYLSTKAEKLYGNYSFSESLYKQLIEFDEYTQTNEIETVFIIVPHHTDLQNRLVEFGLKEEEKRFKEILCSLHAKVYDYDFENEITLLKSNYKDPIHYNDSIGCLIIHEILTDSLKIGRMCN